MAGFYDGDVDALFNSFPLGYRFEPTDQELVDHYLINKIMNRSLPPNKIIFTKDVYKLNPKELTEAYPNYGGREWFFFTSRKRRCPNGDRPDRSAGNGHWRLSGGEKTIICHENQEAQRKTLVFNIRRTKQEKDVKTNWIMHEYSLQGKGTKVEDIVLCKVYERITKESKTGSNEDDLVLGSDEPLPNQSQLTHVIHDGQGKTSSKTRKRKSLEVATKNNNRIGTKTTYYSPANETNHLQGNDLLLHQSSSQIDVGQSQYPLRQPYDGYSGDEYQPVMANNRFDLPIGSVTPITFAVSSTCIRQQSLPSISAMEYGKGLKDSVYDLDSRIINWAEDYLLSD